MKKATTVDKSGVPGAVAQPGAPPPPAPPPARPEQYLNCKFDYTRNYGESMAVHTSISCYALMHPSMMWLGWMYFAIKYFVDNRRIRAGR